MEEYVTPIQKGHVVLTLDVKIDDLRDFNYQIADHDLFEINYTAEMKNIMNQFIGNFSIDKTKFTITFDTLSDYLIYKLMSKN